MELTDVRILVAGASGEVGRALADRLAAGGARLHLAGRDTERLRGAADALGASWSHLDVTAPGAAGSVVGAAVDALGGLDGLVVSVGVPAFGPAADLTPAQHRELMAVNATGPMDLIAAALPRLPDGGAVVAMTAILADHPTAGMAAYSAAKAGLGAYLTAVRREVRRRRITVLDVRAPHLGTRFGERALAGEPPSMAPAVGLGVLADAVLAALAAGRSTVSWDLRARALATT